MKKAFIYSLLIVILGSCQDHLEIESQSANLQQEQSSSEFTIPMDEALLYLEDYLSNFDNDDTKSSKKRSVKSITPITNKLTKTESPTDSLINGPILYVANFDNNEGYAILAADTRIDEPILVITDNGYMDEAVVYSAMSGIEGGIERDKVTIEGYPTTGDGFPTLPETGDEVFMNPNTVDLYDASVQDTYVGNLNLGDYGAIDENGNLVSANVNDINTPEILTAALCVSYAFDEIRNDIIDSGSMPTDDDDPVVTREVNTSDWTTRQIVLPMLTDFVSWSQGEPFNNLCPTRRKFILIGNSRKAAAGCFPLAVAKILAHFQYPQPYTVQGVTIDWNAIKYPSVSQAGQLSAAKLLRHIGSECNSIYFYNGTFTFPSFAESFMESIGYINSNRYDYNFDRVKSMLDNGSPVIIYAVPGINIIKSHSWNIDGYKIKERTVTTRIYENNILIDTFTSTQTSSMVHCDFGWESRCNGYYVSGLFRLNDSTVEKDPGTQHDDEIYFNNSIKIITYNRPL